MPRKRYPVTAAEIDEAVHSLPAEERAIWLQHVRAMIIKHAILTDQEHDALMRRKAESEIGQGIETFETGVDPWQWVVDLLRKSEARNRKSSLNTIRRNVEICNSRRKDPKTWSLRRLGMKYGMAWQSIQKIVRDEQKWRGLARLYDVLPDDT